MTETISKPAAAPKYLIRIPEVFSDFSAEVIRELGAGLGTPLGKEYHLVQPVDAEIFSNSRVSKFIQWKLPVHHSWPCVPQKMEGFIEKAAQAIFRKFGESNPQAIFIGLLEPSASDTYYKRLASNLRGRTLQLFEKLPVNDAE